MEEMVLPPVEKDQSNWPVRASIACSAPSSVTVTAIAGTLQHVVSPQCYAAAAPLPLQERRRLQSHFITVQAFVRIDQALPTPPVIPSPTPCRSLPRWEPLTRRR